MSNPNDDPDVISGLCDDAQKEMATNPGPSHLPWQQYGATIPRADSSATHFPRALSLLL